MLRKSIKERRESQALAYGMKRREERGLEGSEGRKRGARKALGPFGAVLCPLFLSDAVPTICGCLTSVSRHSSQTDTPGLGGIILFSVSIAYARKFRGRIGA